jgi:S-methylmethionine-dependent homocysteine/selenocysteine methylase
MDFRSCYESGRVIMTEGALGIRLRNEYQIVYDSEVANASSIYREDAKEAIRTITTQYLQIASKYKIPTMFMTPTRRANRYQVEHSNYDAAIIADNVLFYRELIEKFKLDEKLDIDLYLGGMMGCKGDAYKATEVLSIEEAYKFHSWQAQLFQQAKVDFLYAAIMPALSEAIGMAKAMSETKLPYIISLMIRANGRMIDGTSIHDAIATIEEAVKEKPIFYMTNCVHPTNVRMALDQEFNRTELVRTRFIGIQANASPMTPEELDGCNEVISSDPEELADEMMKLYENYGFRVLGGCCGTDDSHMEAIADRLVKLR